MRRARVVRRWQVPVRTDDMRLGPIAWREQTPDEVWAAAKRWHPCSCAGCRPPVGRWQQMSVSERHDELRRTINEGLEEVRYAEEAK